MTHRHAFYAVCGDDIFTDFESRFLDRNIQGRLVRLLLSPVNWLRLAPPHFDRSDLASEYYDRHLFEHQTFIDLLRSRQGPFLTINATAMELGFRFEFTQEQFDLLCSDLSTVPVARAVAASLSFPGLLTPITLRNYGGTCGDTEPEWMTANFNALVSDTERRYFNSLPTNLNLPPGATDRLRGVAARLLRESPDWASLLHELRGPEADGSSDDSARRGLVGGGVPGY